MESDKIELIEQLFRHRYNLKKYVNLIISAVIVILGITSLIYIWNIDREGVLTFRWMTVDGTIFTTAIALFFLFVNIFEITRYVELTSLHIYFMRLASAVAESLILVVVLLSQLPFMPDHMHIFRYDMFNMHMMIPVLTVLSFILNDPPIGKLTFKQKLNGTWFVTLYVVVILTIILSGVITADQIPYFFLDVKNMTVFAFIGYFLIVYAFSYLFSSCLSLWNRKLSWLWFRNVTKV